MIKYKLVQGLNDLATLRPDLLAEWDYDKNLGIVYPENVTCGMQFKVWWKCARGHSWKSSIHSRATKNTACPYCDDIRSETLAEKRPDLLKEWDYERNNELGIYPDAIAWSSHKEVCWICSINTLHLYKMTINRRSSPRFPRGCPECNKARQTSYPEQFIHEVMLSIFPDATNRNKIDGYEFDIIVPSLKLAIEYNGEYYHRKLSDRTERENEKADICVKKGYRFIQIIEQQDLKDGILFDTDKIYFRHEGRNDKLHEALMEICEYILNSLGKTLEGVDIETVKANANEYSVLGRPENSFGVNYPHLLEEWDYEKNQGIDPYKISQKSAKKVSWICKKDPSHKWDAAIHNRALHQSGCPRCIGVLEDNSIKSRCPALFKEIHPDKNGHIDIESVTVAADETLNWICPRCKYEWSAAVVSRVYQKSGCRKCKHNWSNKKAISIPKAPWQT